MVCAVHTALIAAAYLSCAELCLFVAHPRHVLRPWGEAQFDCLHQRMTLTTRFYSVFHSNQTFVLIKCALFIEMLTMGNKYSLN